MIPSILRWTFAAAVAGCLALVLFRVNLTPKVESDFFFARPSGPVGADPFRNSDPQILLSIAAPDVATPEYAARIRALGEDLRAVPGVSGTHDILHGPRDLADARKSPLWSRALLTPDGRSTQMVVYVRAEGDGFVDEIERVVAKHGRDDFRISISGVPFVVTKISRHLFRDLKVFSVATLAMFSLLVLAIFRSLRVFLGTIVACLASSILTILLLTAAGQPFGILTGNVLTIAFVLCLSHIVFLTVNWEQSRGEVGSAMRLTVGPSFWAMATTLVSFLTLLTATAKPLREFGMSGALGTAMAMLCAYGIYPVYLRAARVAHLPAPERARAFFARRRLWAFALVGVAFLACLPGLYRLKSDPSLLAYFRPGGEIREGLVRIDERTGSTPLELVVRNPDFSPLVRKSDYDRMWALQRDLEKDPDIGTSLSLAVALAEVDRRGGLFLSFEKKLQALEAYGSGRMFTNEAHNHAKYLLRMHEAGRGTPRSEVLARIRSKVETHGFEVAYFGGLYAQMGELSELVMASVWRGLAGLLVLFAIVSFLVARSPGVAASMALGLVLIAGVLLGLFGLAGVPVDIVSATATNVAIGLAIDGMIHLVAHARRGATWGDARFRMAAPVLASALIIAGGFGIFLLSSFPPTQRFGLCVLIGAVLSAFVVLLVLPQPFVRRDTVRP